MRQYILDRAKEPSTWRGAILFLTAIGVPMAPELQSSYRLCWSWHCWLDWRRYQGMINSRSLDDLLPAVAERVKRFIEAADEAGIDLLVTSTYRE